MVTGIVTDVSTRCTLAAFAMGLDGKLPGRRVVEMAARIAQEALAKSGVQSRPEIARIIARESTPHS